MNTKTIISVTICISLLLLACVLSSLPPWANYIVTIDDAVHYAASYYWHGDELSLVMAEKQIVIFEVGDGVTVEIAEIVRDKS